VTHPEPVEGPDPTHPEPAEGPIASTAFSWWRAGEQRFSAAVERLTDVELAEASRLPGWSRATLLAHVARNADALVNLLTWARTGVETPMYASADARDADIARTAAQPAATLRTDATAAAARLADAVVELPPAAWTARVRTAQGREVPATEVLWLRTREVWVHAVDLDAGLDFTDLPPELCGALVDDVLALLARRDQTPAVTLLALDTDQRWTADPTLPEAPVVRGPVAALAAWLTRADTSGLSGAPPPPLPRWL
jgi:maleylpyruvate isomerase